MDREEILKREDERGQRLMGGRKTFVVIFDAKMPIGHEGEGLEGFEVFHRKKRWKIVAESNEAAWREQYRRVFKKDPPAVTSRGIHFYEIEPVP